MIVTALLLAACSHHEAPVTLTGLAQGTFYSIKYYDSQHRNLQPQIDSLLAAFDLSASLWVDRSLLRRVNAILTDSGMAGLDMRNAFDWLIVYAIAADEDQAMEERLKEVIAALYGSMSLDV